MIMGIISTTDEKFSEDVINSDLPVLIDFWAEWCGPCKMIGPILEELAIEMNEKIKMVKIDVDANSQTAVNYAIRSIPTLIIMKDGEVVAQHIGAASKVQLESFINQNI
ncbi:MAG: thioredoxin [Chloroflexi bacterium]|nr:thioredoxin [Chloroflexota bacterium]